ncbi:extracellular solute-binding protein [Helcococcus kunzii]|uniref:extracellular solute-binding protein n=1 Tax=Helcococcus kunzii TaxID=40091 RepID=UPI0038AB85DB
MKKIIAMLLALVMVFSFVACSNTNDTKDESKGESLSEGDSKDESNKDGNSNGKKLTIYTNSNADGREEWLVSKAKEKGFELQIVGAGGGDTLNRVLAEKGNPQADIVFGLDDAMFGTIKNENLLVEFEPDWAKEVDEKNISGKGYYYPLVEQRIMMLINEKYIKEGPKDWVDLATNEKFKGKYKLPSNLTGGTNQKALISVLYAFKDDAAELGVKEEAWDVVDSWYKNGRVTPEAEDENENFSNGKIPVTFTYSSGIPGAEKQFGHKSTPINPEYGVVSMKEQIGIINKGDDKDYKLAKDFINWFGSAEVQGGWAEEFGSWPVNKKAQEKADKRMVEIMEQTTPMDLDWEWVTKNLSSWIEKVELEIID